MAVKTMSVNTSGDGKFSDGWHELTISAAKYGVYKAATGDKKYITLTFKDYPENMDLRIYEVKNKTTGEEFKISNLFKYANAGIMNVLKDPTGKNPVIQYDDEAENLIDKVVNVLFYKEKKTGKNYTRQFDSIAPIVQEGEHLSYTEDQVNSIKAGIEKNLHKMLNAQLPGDNELDFNTVQSTSTTSPDVPF